MRTFDLFDVQKDKDYAIQLAAMKQRGEIDVVMNSSLSVEQIAALDSSVSSSLIGQQGVFYVGKHGADTNDGRTIEGAMLTFAAATAVAASGEVIKCIDSGLYQESVVLPSGVSLWAPYCTIESPGGGGTGVGCIITNGGEVTIRAHLLTPGSGETGIVQNDYAGVLNIDCDIDGRINGSSDGLLNLSTTAGGIMMARVRSIYVPAGGVGVGDLAVGVGHVHVDIGDIYLCGNGAVGIFLSTTSKLVGRVDHILEYPAGTYTTTKGIDVSAGVANLNVSDITADTVYDAQAGATLNMFVNNVTGAVGAGTGTKNVTTP